MSGATIVNLSVTDAGLTGSQIGFLILDTGRVMDSFSKFGVCLICMLAMVLLAVTPSSASSHGIAGTPDNVVTTNAPLSR
jgi:hypothetical protein